MSPKLPLHPLRLLLTISSVLPIKAQLRLLFWELAVGPQRADPQLSTDSHAEFENKPVRECGQVCVCVYTYIWIYS